MTNLRTICLALIISYCLCANILPVATNFSVNSLPGNWVISLSNDYQSDEYERALYYPCHTISFSQPQNGKINFTEKFFSPFYTQWNYYTRTKTLYYNPNQQYAFYSDPNLTQPVWYAIYSDNTAILLMTNNTCNLIGSFALGFTKDQLNTTNLYPIAQSAAKSAGCNPAFLSTQDPNLGCQTVVNHAIADSQMSLQTFLNAWNVTAVWSSPAQSAWANYQCVSFTMSKNYLLEMAYTIKHYEKDAILNKWKQLEFGVLYVDPTNRAIWHQSHKPPLVVIYYSGQGAVRKPLLSPGISKEPILFLILDHLRPRTSLYSQLSLRQLVLLPIQHRLPHFRREVVLMCLLFLKPIWPIMRTLLN